jgi:hypothetical protein
VSTEVDICNLALAHLGDRATVASISPPEGSAQAEHCARFYPVARDALLEMHTWGFATTRANLAQVVYAFPQWQYVYAAPSNMVQPIAVLPAGALDNYSYPYVEGYTPFQTANTGLGSYTPQPFETEIDPATGQTLILTDVESAVLRYTFIATDAARFTPLFTQALSFLLASYLAGPLIKGDAGMAVAREMEAKFERALAKARSSDGNHSMVRAQQDTPWLKVR